MTRSDVIRMAQEVRLIIKTDDEQYIDYLERFAALVIADFLNRTGQYMTNDASREAAVTAAVAVEREALKKRLIEYANNLEREGEDPRTVRAFTCIVSMKELSDAAAIRVMGAESDLKAVS